MGFTFERDDQLQAGAALECLYFRHAAAGGWMDQDCH